MDEDTRTAASLPQTAGALETACGRRPAHAKDMASPYILPKSCPVLFFLPSANWAAYCMTRIFVIKTEDKQLLQTLLCSFLFLMD